MVGMVQVPSRVTALSAQVERMDGRLDKVVAISDSTQRAKSIEVSWKCLELPDSLFWASRLACGEAFAASRLEPSFWRKARPR